MYNTQKVEKGRFALMRMLLLVVIMVFLAFFSQFGPEPEKETENMKSDSYIMDESYRIEVQSSSF
jgi:hypothetical protein